MTIYSQGADFVVKHLNIYGETTKFMVSGRKVSYVRVVFTKPFFPCTCKIGK